MCKNASLYSKMNKHASLYSEIKMRLQDARERRDKFTTSNMMTFLGDLELDEKRGKKVDDAFVLQKAKKYKQNADSNYELTGDEKFKRESELFESILPKQMTDEQLSDVIDGIIVSGASNMGQVMGILKKQYDGQFDGKKAANIAKERLKDA